MEMSLSKSKTGAFLVECISLGSPLARVTVICAGVALLTVINTGSAGIPNLCLWERIFGWCPAKGTVHALNAFFHGNVKAAVHYHWNVAIIVPMLAVMVAVDMIKIIREHSNRKRNY
jgi:hypothetical protein